MKCQVTVEFTEEDLAVIGFRGVYDPSKRSDLRNFIQVAVEAQIESMDEVQRGSREEVPVFDPNDPEAREPAPSTDFEEDS